MKRILFLLLAASILLPGAAQRRKGAKETLHVSHPAFAASYTYHFVPTDVKVVGDSTVVSFRILNSAGFQLAATSALITDKGDRLPVRSGRVFTRTAQGGVVGAQQMEFDHLYYMVANYEPLQMLDSLTLSFPALPKGTCRIDFTEGYPDTLEAHERLRAWDVFGIRLDGKGYPSVLPASVLDATPHTLPPFTPHWGKARLHLHLLGEGLPATLNAGNANFFHWGADKTGYRDSCAIEVSPDGRSATYTFDACEPFTCQAGIAGASFVPVLAPGTDLHAYVDVNALGRHVQAPAAGIEYLRLQGETAAMSEAMTQWIGRIYKNHFAIRLEELRGQDGTALTVDKLRASHYALLQEWRKQLADDPTLLPQQRDFLRLYAEDCYVNAMERTRQFAPFLVSGTSHALNADSLYEHDFAAADTLPDPHFAELSLFHDDLRGLYVYPIGTDWYAYLKHNGVHGGAALEWARQRQAVADAYQQLARLQCLTPEQLEALPPLYAPAVRAENATLCALLAKTEGDMQGNIQTMPPLREGQTALQAIVEQHRGKYLVVDLWATWCGPCRMGMQAMQPLKQELAGRDDVAFIYITNESSPLREWTETIEAHGGLHYRLDKAQWKRLGAAKNGIPEYHIFDQEGNEVECILGYNPALPDYVRSVLEKAGLH